jgi:hypothetical protein
VTKTKRITGIKRYIMCDEEGTLSIIEGSGFDVEFSTPGLWTLGWVTASDAVNLRLHLPAASNLVLMAAENLRQINEQVWKLVDEDSRVTRTGINFALMLQDRGCYSDGLRAVANMNVGDCINTGVSGYERIS